jgi:two-component system sensor histidine kinase FlrB
MTTGQLSRSEELQNAFVSFERVSATLTHSYRRLERRIGQLTRELGAARRPGARERAQSRMSAVVRALPGGVVVLDGDGRIEACNAAAAELIGPLAPGEPWRDVVARIVAPRWDDGHDLTLSNGRRVHVATEALAAPPGQVLLITDVSATRRLQDDLNRYRRLAAESELAAALAHQIRTPLATAILNVVNLSAGRSGAGAARANAQSVLAPLRHLERLVEDMLVYARCGGFERTPVTVADLLAQLLAVTAVATADGRFRVRVDNRCGEARIGANRDSLVSALQNLVANAAEAANGSGCLDIRVQQHGAAGLVFDFVDDGPGIAPEHAADVFEPFFSTRAGGTGLGLAIVRAIVHAHGGEVEVVPRQGRGAHFRVRIPGIDVPSAQPEGPNA